MKVVLIYRQPREGAHSIEELFRTLAVELGRQAEVIEYEAGSRYRVLPDAWRLRRLGADIYHVTGDINYIALLLPRRKTVLTIHDIGHYLYGLSGMRRWLYKWLWLVLPIRAARMVASGSVETRDNIVKHLGISGERVEMIEHWHSPLFKPAAKPFAAKCPTILQVGTRPYKNVPRLVEALKGVRCRLVLVGSLDHETRQKLLECGVDYENLVEISHQALYQQYVECDIVSFVSLGEGFGVPIIEAQAVGRPLITANLSPMKDVAGEGACLADPLDVAQIGEGIRRIISDEAYRNRLVESGFQNVSRYSPGTAAERYINLYRKLAPA